jgi:hypothetical protein
VHVFPCEETDALRRENRLAVGQDDCEQKARVCQHGAEYCEAGRLKFRICRHLRNNFRLARDRTDFHWSDTWQLVINTVTNIVSMLMVFVIQNTQNRESSALQLKVDELLRAVRGAQNTFINLEELSEEDLNELKDKSAALADSARQRAGQAGGPSKRLPRTAKLALDHTPIQGEHLG